MKLPVVFGARSLSETLDRPHFLEGQIINKPQSITLADGRALASLGNVNSRPGDPERYC